MRLLCFARHGNDIRVNSISNICSALRFYRKIKCCIKTAFEFLIVILSLSKSCLKSFVLLKYEKKSCQCLWDLFLPERGGTVY